MASKTIYPPIVDSYMPAFMADGTNTPCRIYFSLSKFNTTNDFENVQVSIVKQNTGMSVVDSSKDFHKTGIILNLIYTQVQSENNLYYIDIMPNDLYPTATIDNVQYQGFIPGWVYKIQLRLSDTTYEPQTGIGEETWLKNNSNLFSEWSTVCITKAIGTINYTIPIFDIDSSAKDFSISSLSGQVIPEAFINLTGSFINEIDPTELIYSYNFTLFDENDQILEESGEIYSSQFQDNNTINYLIKTELQNEKTYKLAFKYTTINKYEGGFYKVDPDEDIDERFVWVCSIYNTKIPPCQLATIENNINGIITDDITTRDLEEDEGRVAIKFYSSTSELHSCNLCIRRSSSIDNFHTWSDIYVYVCKQENINNIPLFYDYTIESGIWYKYGVQIIEPNGDRGKLQIIDHAVMRNFNYSFILGKDNKQLKLQFDNTMNNFKYQVGESKIDPIGSKFSNIARNTATYYKTFPINGLISFWMDENELFCSKLDLYKYEGIKDLYEKYNTDNGIIQYDYIYEKQFRDAVLDFLYDGEYKLFKSPTEGNIIVRLMDINCVPNQSLSRMIYSFSANAYEMAEANINNYIKYNFLTVAPYDTSFAVSRTKLGQIQLNISTASKSGSSDTDIIAEIIKKYDSGNQNIGGFTQRVVGIHHMKISFDDKPLRLALGEVNGQTIYDVGYQIKVISANTIGQGQIFKIFSPVNCFDFDERISFTPTDKIYVLRDDDSENFVKTMSITVDFLYDIVSDSYKNKQIQIQQTKEGIAQIFKECYPDTNLYREIRYKYYIENSRQFKKLLGLTSIEIEANPGAAFAIKDSFDGREQEHIVGITGILRFYEIENIVALKYLGMKNATTGEIDKIKTDVLMNYHYLVQQGLYKE